MVHYYLILAQWLSLWYTTLSYWPTRYLYCTLLSSTCPLDISLVQYPLLLAIIMVHSYLLLAHWKSQWYTPLFNRHTGYFITLLSSTGPLYISMVHSPPLLTQWLYLWYTTHSYWPTGYPYGTLLSSTGPLDIYMVHYYLLLADWLSLRYTILP